MRLLFTILLFITCSFSNGQNYYSENITSKNGLSDNAIRSLYKDSRGYLWVGTDSGVSRWDGHTFVTYNTLDGLAGNKVWWIDEDNKGNLWFACFGGGISSFDGKTFSSYTDKDGLVDNSVRVVKYNPDFDCLLIGTNKAISVLKDTVFYNFSSQKGDMETSVIITSILSNQNEAVFFDFLGNHFILKQNPDKIFTIKKLTNKLQKKHGASSATISDEGDTIIGWGRDGVVILRNDSVIEIPAIGQVFGMAEDNQGSLWVASWNGNGLAPPGGLFIIKDTKPFPMNRPYKMKSIQGWSMLFENLQNLVFYGTIDKGLYKIPPRYFEYYPPAFFTESDLSVKGLQIDKNNNQWLFTDSLLIFWDDNMMKKIELKEFINSRKQHKFNVDKSGKRKRDSQNADIFYSNKTTYINDIKLDKNSRIWININMMGLFNFPQNNPNKKPTYVVNLGAELEFNDKDTVFRCHAWNRSLVKYHDFKNSEKVTHYHDSLHPVTSKKMVNHKNEIWVFSRIEGVFLYKEGVFRTITSEDSSINKIVNDICFDKEGNAYLGGNDGRIEILDKETRKKIFEVNTPSHQRSVHWLKISKNKLFVGYPDMLGVYNLDSIKNKKVNCQIFTKSEGYVDQGITGSSLDNTGNIWLGTTDGLVKINTELFDLDLKPLKTIIQKVEIFNKDPNWSQLIKTDTWSGLPLETPKLQPDQNHISLYYHTLNYSNNEADLYYYKLAGIDKEWVGPTNKNYVVYPYLNAGKYTFMVKSKNELSGLFSEPATFSFIILTPWYKQMWFIVLIAVLIITMMTILYQFKIKSTRKQEEKKREIQRKFSELETKALQAQMNPHFLFNALNSIQNFMLDNDVDEALTYLSSFSKVVRMTLEFVDQKYVKLIDVLTYLEHYVKLENMRFDDIFDYEVMCHDDIDLETTPIPPMMLQTLIENAIKHGIRPLKRKGKIILEIIKIDNESFKCVIEDNGIGRKKSAQIKQNQNIDIESRGLKIIRERLELLNNGLSGPFNMEIIDLYNDNGEPVGTRVEVTLGFDF